VLAITQLACEPAEPAPAVPCGLPTSNPVACENLLPGSPPSEWDLPDREGDRTIEGFTTDISANIGGTVEFKVDTSASSYRVDIYRLGWYGGNGARKVDTVLPSVPLPQPQPNCLSDTTTGLVDCGNWAVSASWTVPANAVSGLYLARLHRPDTGGASHIPFVVRDDASRSALYVQMPDTTWAAYNQYGGNSLYRGSPAGRAYKVSYNRPDTVRGDEFTRTSLFNDVIPMLRFLERNGYDLSYTSGTDVDRRGELLLQHRAYLSIGHDEYWSARQRANVEAARDAGVHLAFFSGNEIFWKTRWEPSIDGSGTDHRTLVSYKESIDGRRTDPSGVWTGTWRDPTFSPPADGGRPENALTGTIFMVNCCRFDPLTVSAEEGRLRFWRNTGLDAMAAPSTDVGPGVLGYELDADLDNGHRPPGQIALSTTTKMWPSVLVDNGDTYRPGMATHSLTYHRAASGALVFGAGTVHWSWGLDATHDPDDIPPPPADPRIQQATINVLADMWAQPLTLQPGLTASGPPTDTTPAAVAITAPAAGATVPAGTPVTVSGTATDTGGQVGGVEVSTDDGASWHPAKGRGSWAYTFTPTAAGPLSIRARATDDSLNTGAAATVAVTVSGSVDPDPDPDPEPQACPCTVFGQAVPTRADWNDNQPLTLGVRIRADRAGVIRAVRFYKGTDDPGPHTVALWSNDGQQRLASATTANETASGWQEVPLATPVPITPGESYVASYHTATGRYAADNDVFAGRPAGAPPLRATADGDGGPNGLYRYGPEAFPTGSFRSSNYYVDVVFE
jgi:hypothetical protein